MNLDGVIARAVPPPERTGGRFVPVRTDPAILRHRQERMAAVFGSRVAAAAHAEAIGVQPEAWFDCLRDVRLDGEEPVWATLFREIHARLREDSHYPFRDVRKWMKGRLLADWPADLARGPNAHSGFLDYFAERLAPPLQALKFSERQLGLAPTWNERFERSAALAWIFGQVAADSHAAAIAILRRAAEDRQLFSRAFFGADEPGRLLKLEAGLGDPHEGGSSVAILRFERGSVVYKPKDLRIAATVGDITALIGAPGVIGPRMLIRNGYAWEEEWHPAPVAGSKAADAFFQALGGWLAMLQGLAGVDFWFDNLIAAGAIPRFIDFETAVQPLGLEVDPDAALTDVMRINPGTVGILPMFSVSSSGQDPTDLGCVTRPGKHRLPSNVSGGAAEWEESRFAPRLANGAAVDVSDHFNAFEDGYLQVAHALRNRELQSRMMSVLRRSGDATIRVIVADTWTCYRMIRQSLAFGDLSDGVWREIALHEAIHGFSVMTGSLRESAVADMRRLDVPLFHTRLDSRTLFGTGRGRKDNVFALDALSEVPRRLEVLARAPDDERIAWLRSTFSLRKDNPPRRRPPDGRAKLPTADAGNLLEWAREIAVGIERSAQLDERGKPIWAGVSVDVFVGWRGIMALGVNVLCGRSGLAFALRELASGLAEPRLATLAAETLEGAAQDYLKWPQYHINPGFVVGVGGLVTALARTPGLRPLAEKVFDIAADRKIWLAWGTDFVSGLDGWRTAAAALGEPPPREHGRQLPYSPLGQSLLAPWLDPENAAPVCRDRPMAARRRLDRDCHGSWFADRWLDDRHNFSIVNGLPALAVAFMRLAEDEALDGAIIDYLR